MNPHQLKTTDDILLNYTNIEIERGLYVNNSIPRLFKTLGKSLEFIGVDEKGPVRSAVYEYTHKDEIRINLYANAREDYLELVHFQDIYNGDMSAHEEEYYEILNAININMSISKVVAKTEENLLTEMSASYRGDFSPASFVRFMNEFHQDIFSFYKINEIFLERLNQNNKAIQKEISMRERVGVIMTKRPFSKNRKIKTEKIPKTTSEKITKKTIKTDIKIKNKHEHTER